MASLSSTLRAAWVPGAVMDEACSGVRWSGSHGEWEYGGAMPLTGAVRTAKRAPLLQMVKTALATILAWIVAGALIPDGPAPVFAAIAAMLVVQPSLNQSLTKGVERSVGVIAGVVLASRSEEHTSELQSLMRISYAVFC